MQNVSTNPLLQTLTVQFSITVPPSAIPDGHVLMNAPRPLIGKQIGLDEHNHGRFYALIDLADEAAPRILQMNRDLDARLIIPATKDELVDLALLNNKYADRWREVETDDLYSEVSHLVSKIQRIPFSQAVDMFEQIKR